MRIHRLTHDQCHLHISRQSYVMILHACPLTLRDSWSSYQCKYSAITLNQSV